MRFCGRLAKATMASATTAVLKTAGSRCGADKRTTRRPRRTRATTAWRISSGPRTAPSASVVSVVSVGGALSVTRCTLPRCRAVLPQYRAGKSFFRHGVDGEYIRKGSTIFTQGKCNAEFSAPFLRDRGRLGGGVADVAIRREGEQALFGVFGNG